MNRSENLAQLRLAAALLLAGLETVDADDVAAFQGASVAVDAIHKTVRAMANEPETKSGPCGCNCCEACLTAQIERGQREAVRMLDAWTRGAKEGKRMWTCSHGTCVLLDVAGEVTVRKFTGDSAEAARANAAEAIRGEL